MNELKGVLLYLLLRDATGPIPQRRDKSIAWPCVPANDYEAEKRCVFRDADATNARVEAYVNDLNRQRKVSHEHKSPA